LVDALYGCRAFDEMKSAAERLRARHPSGPEGYIGLGLAALGQKDRTLAERSFREALRVDPTSSLALNNLAVAICRKQPKEAVELLRRSVALDPPGKFLANNFYALLDRYVNLTAMPVVCAGLGLFFWFMVADLLSVSEPIGSIGAGAWSFVFLGTLIAYPIRRRRRINSLGPDLERIYRAGPKASHQLKWMGTLAATRVRRRLASRSVKRSADSDRK
jgi:tetratricopeptide (TPR) repeat protein